MHADPEGYGGEGRRCESYEQAPRSARACVGYHATFTGISMVGFGRSHFHEVTNPA